MSLIVSLLNQLRLFSRNQGFPVVGVNLFGIHIFRLPKLLSFEKFFMGGFLQINLFKIKIYIFVLCVRFAKSTMNLFNIYFLNVLMLCVFGIGFDTFFLLMISLIRMIFFLFIKSDGSPLVKLVKLAVITFSIWMIWRMRNYARF